MSDTFKKNKKGKNSEEDKNTKDSDENGHTSEDNQNTDVKEDGISSEDDLGKNGIRLKSQEDEVQNSKALEIKSRDKTSPDGQKSSEEKAQSSKDGQIEYHKEDSENSSPDFTIDDAVNAAGYGKFQKLLTFLAGLGWLADAFEVIILSFLGDFLACEWTLRRWQIALMTSVVFIGMTCGAPLFGKVADHFGRKCALGVSMLFLFLFGVASAFSPDYVTISILRFLMGIALGGVAQGVTLCCEYYPAKDRGIAGFYLSYYWAFGTLLLILFTWLIMHVWNSWKILLIAAALPALVVFCVMPWYPESARYYLVSGNYDKAVKQLEQMVTMNGKEMPDGKLTIIEEEDMEKRGNIKDLFKKEHRVTTILFWYIWFAIAFTYYGVALISPTIIKNGHLRLTDEERAELMGANATSGDDFMASEIPCKQFTTMNYVDLLWTSAAEFPGLFVFTVLVKYCERKRLLSFSCFVTAVAILLLLIETHLKVVMNIILFFSRAIITALFQLLFIMTSEAFPTTLRAVGMGAASAWARIGGAIVPFAAQYLLLENAVATVCILATVVFLAGVSAACLPLETKDSHMRELTRNFMKKVTRV